MAGNLAVHELHQQPAFAALAKQYWPDIYGRPAQLCVLMTEQQVGHFATAKLVDQARDDQPLDVDSIFFVTDHSLEPYIKAPSNPQEVEELSGGDYSFQNELADKGLGVLGANWGGAHARGYSSKSRAAIRKIVLPNGIDDIYVEPGSGSFLDRRRRWLRHGAKLLGAEVGDVVHEYSKRAARHPEDTTRPGTDRAVECMNQRYGGKICALLQLSPSIYTYQRKNGLLRPGLKPGHVLARGAVDYQQFLAKVGECDVPQPRRGGSGGGQEM